MSINVTIVSRYISPWLGHTIEPGVTPVPGSKKEKHIFSIFSRLQANQGNYIKERQTVEGLSKTLLQNLKTNK